MKNPNLLHFNRKFLTKIMQHAASIIRPQTIIAIIILGLTDSLHQAINGKWNIQVQVEKISREFFYAAL
jgi:hypothetical protein